MSETQAVPSRIWTQATEFISNEDNREQLNSYKTKYISAELICLFVWVYGIPTTVGYLMPNPFYTYKLIYFKQSSLA